MKKPVALPQLDRLVMVLTLAPEQTLGWNQVSPADYLDWKNQSHSFSDMAAMELGSLEGRGEAGY
ncbi:MAG: hypothetical protein WCA38_13350 [Candidatus Acidiferrales bacterium]